MKDSSVDPTENGTGNLVHGAAEIGDSRHMKCSMIGNRVHGKVETGAGGSLYIECDIPENFAGCVVSGISKAVVSTVHKTEEVSEMAKGYESTKWSQSVVRMLRAYADLVERL